MALVSMAGMLEKARQGKYAVGQFNINNLEWTKSILTVAQELNSPVILGVSEGAAKYMGGFKTVAGMVKGLIEDLKITVEVGFVVGITPAITPIGSAILIMPLSLSSSNIPHVFVFLNLL